MAIADLIRERGPMTVAAFMELALYDPVVGYYARAAQRSGRAGDFFTSVDVGPLFGGLLARQIAEMAALLSSPQAPASKIDLVEVGAGNGRLSADILRALRASDPSLFGQIALHLVEASEEARAAQTDTLGDLAGSLRSSSDQLPATIEGVVLANELLDAFPVHQVVMREDGLREVYVTADGAATDNKSLRIVEGTPSTPALQQYLDRLGVSLEPGWHVEINLGAIDWVHDIARRLRRGFVILIDYGHEARHLYSASHSSGTLATFSRHTMASPADRAARDQPAWLQDAGNRDITSHVDFTSVRRAAEAVGLTTLGFLDQTYFVLGLAAQGSGNPTNLDSLETRLAFKTLMLPGGLGSTHKVLLLGKDVGAPHLVGCSFRMRVT